MAHSGRMRHRDREPRREDPADDQPIGPRVFKMTDEQRKEIAVSLRAIDEARQEIESRHDATNRLVVRALRASADQIYDILNELEVVNTESLP